MLRIKKLCQDCKIELSGSMKSTIVLDRGDDDVTLDITLAEFEEISKPLLDRIIPVVESLLKQAGLNKESVDDIVLAGGSTEIPAVRQKLEAYFGK